MREVEKKIAQYQEHVEPDHRPKPVAKGLDQARLAVRKGFDRLLAAVSTPAAKRPKKPVTKKAAPMSGPRKKSPRPNSK